MNAKKALIVLAVLGIFSGTIAANEKYKIVKVWPEVPIGWHFYSPRGVAVDKTGNVYIGDSGNYRVKKFDSEGRFITQWGSPGSKDGQFETIGSIKVDSSGIVYVLDRDRGKWEHSRIQKFSPFGQFIGKLERTAPDADKTKQSIDVAFDNKGNILILAVDYNPKPNLTYGVRIEKYSRYGKFISQWAATAGSGEGQFQRPSSIDVDAKGNIYITGINNCRVQKFDSFGKFIMKWGSRGEEDGLFSGGARSIDFDKMGNIYVLDYNSVQKFTPAGEFLARWKTKSQQASRLALDSNSNIYVTDLNSHVVAKIDPEGNVTSQWGCAGNADGLFNLPGSIAVNQSGQMFVADTWNYRIQSFDSDGKFLSRWGAEHWFAIQALASDASGNIYVACGGANEVRKYDPHGKLICRWGSTGNGDGQFNFPSAIAVGPSGNIYAADSDNSRVQKFSGDGKFLAKWGTEGTVDGLFDGAFFIAVDDSGNVWIGDQLGNGTHRMQKFDANGKFLKKWTRKIMTPPGAGYCGAVAVDSAGNSYYAFESRIEKYSAMGDVIDNYGKEKFINDNLESVKGICVDKAGWLYITDSSGSIRKFDADGKLIIKWTPENLQAKEKYPNGPITVNNAGSIFLSYWNGASIWRLSSDGRPVVKFRIEDPSRKGRFTELGGLAVDCSGQVYAVDSIDIEWEEGMPSIQKFDACGQFITTWQVPNVAGDKFKYPAQIAIDGLGNAYVTDQSSHCVHKLDAQGMYIKSWGGKGTGDGQFDSPEGIVVDGVGHVYVCDRQNSRIQKFDSDGKFLAKWGKEGSGDGEFHFPAAVAIDKEGYVFVADSDNNRIQKFTPEGKFLTDWGEFGEAPGQFRVPLGIAVDASGNVYVSDSHNHRIQKFAPVPSR
jgi:tripartite motif-containing protein 71